MSTQSNSTDEATLHAWFSARSHIFWAAGVATVMLTALIAGTSESSERYKLDNRLHRAAQVIDEGVLDVQQFFPGSFR